MDIKTLQKFHGKGILCVVKLAKMGMDLIKFLKMGFNIKNNTDAKLEFVFFSVKRTKFSSIIGLLLIRNCNKAFSLPFT